MDYSSGWSNFRLERISPGLLAHRGEEAVQHLERRGIHIPPSNRLERAVHLTRRANAFEVEITPEDPEAAARVLEAFRTLFETFVIVWTAVERRRRVNPFPNERLKYLLEGADVPWEEKNSKPRDTQFELMVGASLVLGGADLLPDEPDYRLLYHGDYIGVAAKRLKSTNPNTLRSTLRNAARQIASSTRRGIVALNLDSWVTDLSPEDVEEVGRNFNEQVREAHRQLQVASERQALLGAVIYGFWSRWVFGGETPIIDWRSPTQNVMFTEIEAEVSKSREYFDGLRDRFERGLSELGRLIQAGA